MVVRARGMCVLVACEFVFMRAWHVCVEFMRTLALMNGESPSEREGNLCEGCDHFVSVLYLPDPRANNTHLYCKLSNKRACVNSSAFVSFLNIFTSVFCFRVCVCRSGEEHIHTVPPHTHTLHSYTLHAQTSERDALTWNMQN